MSGNQLPREAFIDPRGNNRKEAGKLARRILDLVLDHVASSATRPPIPKEAPLAVPATISEEPVAEETLLAQLQSLLDASLNDSTPNYIGHMDSLSTTFSLLGDFVAAATNNNMLSREMSPAFSCLEDELLRDFARLFGLGEKAGGVMASGGSLTNLHALAVARNTKLGTMEQGVHKLEKTPVLFASEVAHASIKKSAMLLGLGTGAVILVTTNKNAQMDPADLLVKIKQAQASGFAPFCVVATAGNTTTGNIDPLPETGKIARKFGLWFHVDAVWGGGLQFSETHRSRLAGIEQADSVTFNPQKMLLVARTCSMALFRDFDTMKKSVRIPFPYMRETEGFTNLGEISLQGSRAVEVLKLWLSLQHIGRKNYAEIIDRRIALTDSIAQEVTARPFLELAATPETGIVCFRAIPDWLPETEWEEWTSNLQAFILKEAGIYLSFLPYKGKRWLRVVLLNPYTDEETVQRLLNCLDALAEEGQNRPL
jgi:glutamate/tyrosine decarboxylase-like PLP-dependent enzyme